MAASVRPDKDVSIMLVLSRKSGEAIVVGQDVEVTVLEVRGNRVKLGLRGPSDVAIHREELHARINSGEADRHLRHLP
jgi:carbon storage regulator